MIYALSTTACKNMSPPAPCRRELLYNPVRKTVARSFAKGVSRENETHVIYTMLLTTNGIMLDISCGHISINWRALGSAHGLRSRGRHVWKTRTPRCDTQGFHGVHPRAYPPDWAAWPFLGPCILLFPSRFAAWSSARFLTQLGRVFASGVSVTAYIIDINRLTNNSDFIRRELSCVMPQFWYYTECSSIAEFSVRRDADRRLAGVQKQEKLSYMWHYEKPRSRPEYTHGPAPESNIQSPNFSIATLYHRQHSVTMAWRAWP